MKLSSSYWLTLLYLSFSVTASAFFAALGSFKEPSDGLDSGFFLCPSITEREFLSLLNLILKPVLTLPLNCYWESLESSFLNREAILTELIRVWLVAIYSRFAMQYRHSFGKSSALLADFSWLSLPRLTVWTYLSASLIFEWTLWWFLCSRLSLTWSLFSQSEWLTSLLPFYLSCFLLCFHSWCFFCLPISSECLSGLLERLCFFSLFLKLLLDFFAFSELSDPSRSSFLFS